MTRIISDEEMNTLRRIYLVGDESRHLLKGTAYGMDRQQRDAVPDCAHSSDWWKDGKKCYVCGEPPKDSTPEPEDA
jgi:hypothetical protein